MVSICHERAGDVAARDALLDLCLGEAWRQKASERLREGRRAAAGLSLVATDGGRVIGTVRLWHVTAAGRAALLLGPLAVDSRWRGRGVGAVLMRRALAEARRRGHAAVLLVGDAPYYGRFGFSAQATGQLRMPGPYERDRLLAVEFAAGWLENASGAIEASGRLAPAEVAEAAPAARASGRLSQAA